MREKILRQDGNSFWFKSQDLPHHNVGEFFNNPLKEYFEKKGVVSVRTTSWNSMSNGLAEIQNQIFLSKARPMLMQEN